MINKIIFTSRDIVSGNQLFALMRTTMHPVSSRPVSLRPAVQRRMSLTAIKRYITTPASSVDILTASAYICTIRVLLLWMLLLFTSSMSLFTLFTLFILFTLLSSFNHCCLFVLYGICYIINNFNHWYFLLILLNGL